MFDSCIRYVAMCFAMVAWLPTKSTIGNLKRMDGLEAVLNSLKMGKSGQCSYSPHNKQDLTNRICCNLSAQHTYSKPLFKQTVHLRKAILTEPYSGPSTQLCPTTRTSDSGIWIVHFNDCTVHTKLIRFNISTFCLLSPWWIFPAQNPKRGPICVCVCTSTVTTRRMSLSNFGFWILDEHLLNILRDTLSFSFACNSSLVIYDEKSEYIERNA